MKRKIFSVLFAVMLTLSLSLVMAAPVAAADEEPTYAGYAFQEDGAGSAEWSTTYARTGSYSVKLYAPGGGGGYGMVIMPLEMAFAADLDFSVYLNGGDTAQDLPMLGIRLDPASVSEGIDLPGDGIDVPSGVTLIQIVSQPLWATDGDFKDLQTDAVDTTWELYGTTGTGTLLADGAVWNVWWLTGGDPPEFEFSYAQAGGTFLTWAEIQTAFGGVATIQDFRVENSYPEANSTVYVDDMTINDITYEMEPMVLDAAVYNIGETVTVTVLNGNASGTIAIFAKSDTVGEEGKIIIALHETATGSGIFTGSFDLVSTTPGTGELLVNVGDSVDVKYTGDWGAGSQLLDWGDPPSATVVDSIDPTIETDTLIQPNGDEIIQGGAGTTYEITWTAGDITDANLGTTPITLEYSTDDGENWTQIATNEANDGSYTWSPVATENSSLCLVKIIASDLAANTDEDESDAVFDIDAVEPESSIDALANDYTNDSTPTFTGNSIDIGTTYVALVECKVDDGEWTAATPDAGDFDEVSEDWSFTTATLADGDHTIYARATDAAGNVESTAEYDFSVDTVSPTVTIVTEPDDIIESTTADYAGTAADAAPSSGLYQVLYQLDGGAWDEANLTDGDWDFQLTGLSSGPHTVNIKAVDVAGNETTPPASHSFIVDLVPGPPVILDAVTGWNWWFSPDECPEDRPAWEDGPDIYWCCDKGIGYAFNANDRSTIIVVFSEPLDPVTVDKADFTVTGYRITEVALRYGHCNHPHEWDELSTSDFGLVFLKVAPLMSTYATPTVNLVGTVSDWAGFPSEPDMVVAQDGIAPVITLSSNPVEPVYNQPVTITATSTEVLSEAYCCLTDDDSECSLMTPSATGKVWTYEFLWPYPPMEKIHIKVWAHDETDFVECKWWKHQKWTEESLIFGGGDYVGIDLCEGWNLISVPKDLISPSLSDVFGDGSVTKVHHWTGYGWQSAKFNPTWGTWGGAIYNIVPGKGYWVWCSPNYYHLGLLLALPDPMSPPPAYSLVKGWNLIGYTVFSTEAGEARIKQYLTSLRPLGETIMYTYDPCDHTGYGPGWVRYHSGGKEYYWNWHDESMIRGMGYWIFMNQPGVLAP